VVNTLLRFAHTPVQGAVLLDNVSRPKSLKLASLRQVTFAVVSQDIVLFDGSVAQ
jgi:ABC-type multidrug transport system fused ATPase/permease subunit